jgi:hypothetical protein
MTLMTQTLIIYDRIVNFAQTTTNGSRREPLVISRIEAARPLERQPPRGAQTKELSSPQSRSYLFVIPFMVFDRILRLYDVLY